MTADPLSLTEQEPLALRKRSEPLTGFWPLRQSDLIRRPVCAYLVVTVSPVPANCPPHQLRPTTAERREPQLVSGCDRLPRFPADDAILAGVSVFQATSLCTQIKSIDYWIGVHSPPSVAMASTTKVTRAAEDCLSTACKPPSKRTKRSLDTLDDDVLLNIASNLPQESVLSLMLTSRRFVDVCKRRLYHTIIICEKSSDQFFIELAHNNGWTVLSSWPRILKFFRDIVAASKGHDTPPIYLSYIVELRTWNPLDSGRLDLFRNSVTDSDRMNMLQLRELWSIAIQAMPNLTTMVSPYLTLDRLALLGSSVWSDLKKATVNADVDFPLPDVDELSGLFRNVDELTLNFTHDMAYTYANAHLSKILGVASLERLEFNWCMGEQDRYLEHTLRHCSIQDTLSSRSLALQSVKRLNKGFNKRNSDETALLTAIDAVHREGNWIGKKYTGLCPTRSTTTPDDWIEACSHIISSVSGVESITFRNICWQQKVGEDDKSSLVLSQLKSLLTRPFSGVKELHFVGCLLGDVAGLGGLQQSPHTLSILNILSQDWFINYPSLRKLTLGQTIVQNINHPADTTNHPSLESYVTKTLRWYMEKTPSKLKALTCYGSKSLKLTQFRESIAPMKSLETVVYLRHDRVLEICQRVIGCQSMKYTNNIDDLEGRDHELFVAAKNVIEMMNYSHRVDDYGQTYDHCDIFEEVKDAFMFLYGSWAKSFFLDLPNLKVFVLYGFPFRREMFMLHL